MRSIAAFVVLAGLPVAASAQSEALASDTALDAIYRMADLNGDGDFSDAGEVNIFFDASNAAGLGNAAGSVFTIVQSPGGSVYIGDGDTDAVYRLIDLNGDGDANDSGEAVRFYSAANGPAIQTPNGVALVGDAVYIVNAGANPSTADAIVRCEDLNGDGDADDAGESTLWADLSLVANSTPFGAVASGDSIYFVDGLAGSADVIFKARDADGNGSLDTGGELGVFVDSALAATPVGFGLALVPSPAGDTFYVIESSGSVQAIRRLVDADGSGTIDAGESAVIWSESSLLPGTLGTAFDIAVTRANGVTTALVPSSGADSVDAVYVLRDANDDGDFDDAGETLVGTPGNGSGVFPDTIRALAFYRGPTACPADFNGDGFIDFFDYDDFVGAFETGGGLEADFNGDGFVDFFDYDAFVEAFETGC